MGRAPGPIGRRAPLAAAAAATVVVTALVLAGCGSGEESPSARRSATRWAATVCADLGRWIDTASSGSPSGAAEAALRLRAEIARAEAPVTDDGLAAQGEMEKLATAIEARSRAADPATIEETVADARTALDGIRGLTPGGAVEAALDDAPPCHRLRG